MLLTFLKPKNSIDCLIIPSSSRLLHYSDIIIGAMASQIVSLIIVYSTVHSGADQRKHQSSVSLAYVQGIHRWPVNSQHKWPVTRKMFPFDHVIMSHGKNLLMTVIQQQGMFDPKWRTNKFLVVFIDLIFLPKLYVSFLFLDRSSTVITVARSVQMKLKTSWRKSETR